MTRAMQAVPAVFDLRQVYRGEAREPQRIRQRIAPTYAEATPYIEQRLAEIKREFGAKLMCHPDYVPIPRHSLNPEIYQAARAPYLAAILAAAKRDRERNPAFTIVNRIRAIVGDMK